MIKFIKKYKIVIFLDHVCLIIIIFLQLQFAMLEEDKEKLIEAQINAPPLMLEDKDKAAQVKRY